jgi:hypothetical protein
MFEHGDEHRHEDDCNRTHPRDRDAKPDDPLELSGIEVEGDPEVMLDCIVEEYARMGCGADDILRMFDDPFFQGPYGLTRAFGRDYVRLRVQGVLRRCGVLRVRVVEQPSEREDARIDAERGGGPRVSLTVGGRPIAERN